KIDFDETDLFKRIEKIGLKKLHIQQEYPQVFDFLVASMQEESTEVSYIIHQKIDHLYIEGTEKLYKNIDYSKFREGIDVEKAINIIILKTLENNIYKNEYNILR